MTEFLAEASVLILPDTKAFRAQLLKDVEAAVKEAQALAKVSLTGVATGGTTGAAAAGTAIKELSKEKQAAAAATRLLTSVEERQAAVEQRVLASSTQAAAARTRFTAATRDVILTEQAYAKALKSSDDDLIATAALERDLAQERKKGALDTLRAAQANAAAAATAQKATAANARAAGVQTVGARVAAAAGEETAALHALTAAQNIVSLQEKREVAIVGDAAVARSRYAAAVRASAILQQQANQINAETSPILAGVIELETAYARNLELTTKQQLESAIAGQARTAELNKESAAATRAAAAEAERAATLGRGAAAAALSATGLRGATLAASGPFIAGAAAAIAFGKSLSVFADFQTQLNTLRVTAGATSEEMQRVSEAAKQLGADVSLPGVSAGDAAQAMTELSKAGLSVQDSIDGARGVLELATAAGIDNAQATELAANALNAFGLAGDQAVHVADVLANSANDAQGSISDVATALQQAAAVGRQAGLSLEQTTAVLTLFARNGLRGSDAGTSFRTMLIRLINPTQKAQEIIKKLNLDLRDSSGAINLRVFQQFANATRDMTKAERDRDLAILFGQDAIRGASIIVRQGNAALDAQVESLNKAGTAADVAAARNAGLAGASANLQNQLETTGLAVGQLASGPLTVLLDALASDVKGVNDFIAALGRIPHSVPLPNLQIPGTGTDTQKVTKGFADRFKEGFTKGLGKSFAAVSFGPAGLSSLQKVSDTLEKAFPSKASLDAQGKLTGANLRSAIEDAAREAVVAANDSGSKLSAALAKGFSLTSDLVEQAIKAGRAKLVQSIQNAGGQQVGLEDVFNQILLVGGSPQAQIANLQKQFATQQSIIDKAATGLKGLSSGDKGFATLIEAVRKARAKQVQINGQIASIQGQVVSDQQAAASDAKQKSVAAQAARDAADQAIVDSFAPAEQKLDVREAAAQATGNVQKIVAAEQARVKQLNVEIAAIDKGFKNRQQASALISQKRVQVITLNAKISSDLQSILDSAITVSPVLQAQINLAQAQGNVALQIKLNNVLIKQINAKIASDNLVGAALNAAKAQRATLQQQNADLADQQRQDQIALGQSILDLTGNKDPILKALNSAISSDQKKLNALKAAGKSTVKLQTEINNLLKQRQDIIKGAADDTKKTTTAFDLLKEFNARFNDIAGNLITPDQPFAGGQSFTTDIVNKAIANVRLPTVPQPGVPKGDDVVSRAINANTEALRANTEAVLRGKGNVSTSDGSDGVGPATIGQWGGKAWWSARNFRDVRDG